MTKILLDTNAYSRFLAGDTDVFQALSGGDTIYLSVFVLGELYAGFLGGTKERDNRSLLSNFLSKPTVKLLMATLETAEVFGSVKNALKVAGSPIPINDVWIAAHALETGSTVITYDEHFKRVPGLRIWNVV